MSEQSLSQPGDVEALMRPADEVMSLERLGSIHPNRLSFTRTLVRRMHRERWRVQRALWEMNDDGHGRGVYRIDTGREILSFAVFTNALSDAERTDRVIATQWDAAFALVAGEPDEQHLRDLERNVPRQEAGRVGSRELVLSRANKSVRIFQHVVDSLACGCQPDAARLIETGYLMRTTAVYGNGKFGLADLDQVRHGGVFTLPYQAEMLTVYLARELSVDLVEHVAARRAPERATTLAPELRRAIGVGNATGLGMAPFLVRHPQLIHRWMWARERALAGVKSIPRVARPERARFVALLERALAHVAGWRTDDERQRQRIDVLLGELRLLVREVNEAPEALLGGDLPYLRLCARLESRASLETQELVNSLLLELNPDEVDALETTTAAEEALEVEPRMTVSELAALLERDYRWALDVDFEDTRATAWFWYVSQEKSEPRLGERGVDPGDELEMRIDIARQVQGLYASIRACGLAENATVAEFLLAAPSWRGVVARVQTLAGLAYAEIHGNLLARDTLAIDLLRAKLATFGAGRFDPKSDRWTRITLFQGAPTLAELDAPDADDWWMPVLAGES